MPQTMAHSIYPLCQPQETNPTLYPLPNTPRPASHPALPGPTSPSQPRAIGATCNPPSPPPARNGYLLPPAPLEKTQHGPVTPSTLSTLTCHQRPQRTPARWLPSGPPATPPECARQAGVSVGSGSDQRPWWAVLLTLMCVLARFRRLSVVWRVLSGPRGTSCLSCSR